MLWAERSLDSISSTFYEWNILLFWYYFPQCMWTMGVVRKQHHVIVFLWLKIYLFIFHWWSKPYYTLIKQHVVRKDQLNIKHFCFLVFVLVVGWLVACSFMPFAHKERPPLLSQWLWPCGREPLLCHTCCDTRLHFFCPPPPKGML